MEKSYRAIRHDIIREKQKNNSDEVHHPDQKKNQIHKVLQSLELNGLENISILELFAGSGNLTSVYSSYGKVLSYENNTERYNEFCNIIKASNVQKIKEDSYLAYHELIYHKHKFNIIDLDPYGFPNRFFPDIFLLIDEGIMFITMPKPYVNILNGITQTHLISYYGEHNPSKEVIIEKIALFGLCHWRKIELIDEIDCKSVWRFAFAVKKVKATEYTGVNNKSLNIIDKNNIQQTLF